MKFAMDWTQSKWTVEMATTMIKHLECPVCYTTNPEVTMFTCRNGHMVCGECRRRLPKSRVSYGRDLTIQSQPRDAPREDSRGSDPFHVSIDREPPRAPPMASPERTTSLSSTTRHSLARRIQTFLQSRREGASVSQVPSRPPPPVSPNDIDCPTCRQNGVARNMLVEEMKKKAFETLGSCGQSCEVEVLVECSGADGQVFSVERKRNATTECLPTTKKKLRKSS